MSALIIIPARAGSKGLPGKNTKLLGDKPLISYTFDFAKKIKGSNDVICLSTNDDEVIKVAKAENIEVLFRRPEELASDTASSYDVIMHSLKYFSMLKREFKKVVLLQPTSPFRIIDDYRGVLGNFDNECDMAVTVKQSKENPYFTLFEEDDKGFLRKSKAGNFQRRQDCPLVYTLNGSIYLIRVSSLKKGDLGTFANVRKSLMPDDRSIDIDTYADWMLAEYFLDKFIDENS